MSRIYCEYPSCSLCCLHLCLPLLIVYPFAFYIFTQVQRRHLHQLQSKRNTVLKDSNKALQLQNEVASRISFLIWGILLKSPKQSLKGKAGQHSYFGTTRKPSSKSMPNDLYSRTATETCFLSSLSPYPKEKSMNQFYSV